MDQLWKNLEHLNPNEFGKDDYTYLTYLVLSGLRSRHGEVEPKYAFVRSEEPVGGRKSAPGKTVRLPRLTVCYLRRIEGLEPQTAVGLAFCSNGDNPNKWYGRALAFKRSVTALIGRHLTEENYIREGTEFATFLTEIGSPVITKSFLHLSSDFVLVKRNNGEETNGTTSATDVS